MRLAKRPIDEVGDGEIPVAKLAKVRNFLGHEEFGRINIREGMVYPTDFGLLLTTIHINRTESGESKLQQWSKSWLGQNYEERFS